MGWLTEARNAYGIQTMAELARRVRNKTPGSLAGVPTIKDHLKSLGGEYTPGCTAIEKWFEAPLLWWVQRPEYVQALEEVLEGEIKPFTEQYWLARSAYCRHNEDSPATYLKELEEEAEERRTLPRDREFWGESVPVLLRSNGERVTSLAAQEAVLVQVGDLLRLPSRRMFTVVARRWSFPAGHLQLFVEHYEPAPRKGEEPE